MQCNQRQAATNRTTASIPRTQAGAPNWAVKRTPTLAMASPFSWPVSVPSAFGSGAAYLER